MDAADLCKKILNLYYRRQLIDQVSENYLLERKIRLQFSSAVEDLMISDLPQSPLVEVTTAESILERVHVSLGELHSRIKYVQKHVIPTIPNVERVTASPEPQQPQSTEPGCFSQESLSS
ncbi:unnamed protein product [Trifolium pratense]|uniref:Uncharacterized protein n=1 Tax=Trifolium pratense TaxID=57577 RepID=A0ACB0K8Y2_TRIPR|nr:unnamed protein product [Trifolium pratense]